MQQMQPTNPALGCLVVTLLLLQSLFAWHDHREKQPAATDVHLAACVNPAMLYQRDTDRPRLICATQMPLLEESLAQIDCRTATCNVIPGGMLNSWRLALGAPLNLNTATVEELMLLPNLGRKMAEAIVTQRTIEGGFRDLQTVQKVRGIGPKRLDAMRALLRLD